MVLQVKIDYINRLIDKSLSEGENTIELKGKFIGDEGVEALIQSERIAGIEDLDLSRNSITWRGAVQLFQCNKCLFIIWIFSQSFFITKNCFLPPQLRFPDTSQIHVWKRS